MASQIPTTIPHPRFIRFREPVNGLLHLAGCVLALLGTVALAWACRVDAGRMASGVFYGLTMVGCFLASTLHHLVRGERALEMRLLRWDHAAIYPFIAGTYTPICLWVVPGIGGRLLDFKPGLVCHHEIWHVFVLTGAALMSAFVWQNFVPIG